MGISLNAFDVQTNSNAGVEFELKDYRTGKGTGAFIKLLGMDSDAVKAFMDAQARKYSELRKAGKEVPKEDPEQSGIELLTVCTVGWRGIDDANGQPLEFSKDTARRIYAEYPLIREFVDRVIAVRENFLLG